MERKPFPLGHKTSDWRSNQVTETVTRILVPDWAQVQSEISDLDFVFGLAYLALEHEAEAARSTAAKIQIGHLLDRLQNLDFRD